jgi:hypothetical protein
MGLVPSIPGELVQGEMVSLNLADLDVEELERRLELSMMVPNSDCWSYCSNNCGCNCIINCL